ncbi:Hypothetical protein CLAU_1503 [Clostridium autoethanogenum DSM 10061]|nr:Hypothetical protein CLAU_1503 [Clostridium autoethanogenum DSM 10061]
MCYLAIKKASRHRESIDTGAPREIRTPGLWIRSPSLYPAELWVLILFNYKYENGAGEENRTLITSLEG